MSKAAKILEPEPPRTIMDIHMTYSGYQPNLAETQRYLTELYHHRNHLLAANRKVKPAGPGTPHAPVSIESQCRQSHAAQRGQSTDQV